jgi:hypothetical protein
VRATCSVWLRSLALASVTAMCFAANAQQSGATVSDEASAHRQGENTGEDFFRPPTNLFQAMTEYRTSFGTGSNGAITNVTTETLNFRYDHSVDLAPMWILALRSDMHTLGKNPITPTNPNGDYLIGLGDADTQAAIIHNLSSRWAVGFGARLITPTGGDTFGAGKWQVMPIAGVRYELWEINSFSYFEPIFRYDVSFAGDPTRKNIRNLQIAPALNIGLPDQWYVTFYPDADIRINFGDPITGQTGRLFLPFDVRIGRQLASNASLSFEIGVPIIKDYPIYNIKTQTRFNLTF